MPSIVSFNIRWSCDAKRNGYGSNSNHCHWLAWTSTWALNENDGWQQSPQKGSHQQNMGSFTHLGRETLGLSTSSIDKLQCFLFFFFFFWVNGMFWFSTMCFNKIFTLLFNSIKSYHMCNIYVHRFIRSSPVKYNSICEK